MITQGNTRFHDIGLRLLLVAGILVGLAAPATGEEIYTSANANYPDHFKNIYNNDTNQLTHMEAVSFGGREIIIFSIWSTGNDKSDLYTSGLRFFTPGYDFNRYLDFQNMYASDLRFKTAVFNNTLYLFYTANVASVYETDRIYYRTIQVEYGETADDWRLLFSDQKSLPAGIDWTTIRMVKVMNGELYVIFSDKYYESPYVKFGNHWYYISTADGVTFGPTTSFFTSTDSPMGWWASGAVFSTPDASGNWSEKLMIAYCTGGDLIYFFFFDGESNGYGHVPLMPGLPSIHSVRLVAGTAEGYTDNRHAIQIFFTTPSSAQWAYMYHGEYIPSGPGGNAGTWMTNWGHLWLSNEEGVHCEWYYSTDPSWAVLPVSTVEGADTRMNVRLWYFRGTKYVWEPFGLGYDIFQFRRSTYRSDLLVAQEGRTIRPPADLSAATVVGIIEGPPPFPENGGFPDQASLDISSVVMTEEYGTEFKTTWSAGVGVAVSYGGEFGPVGAKAEVSSEVKYTKETSEELTTTIKNTFFSYDYTTPGGLGWVLVLKPEIRIDPFVQRSYNGKPLFYDAIADEHQVMAVSYGPGTQIVPLAYQLVDPPAPFGSDAYPAIFAGMASRPLSTIVHDWQWEVDCNPDGTCVDPSYSVYLYDDGVNTPYNPLPAFTGTQGVQNEIFLTLKTTEAETDGISVNFSVSASAFGFETSSNINYALDIKTSTSMTKSLGFLYNVQGCDDVNPCVGFVDIYPYMLIPSAGDSGYDAPWISDNIRMYRKPKPWAISYTAIPSNPLGATAMDIARLTVKKANGTLFLDRGDWTHDRMTARFTLEGISPEFFLDREDDMHLRLGNYLINSERNVVVSRAFQGNHLILEIREEEDSDSRIRVKFSYNRAKSELDIFVDAENIDLSHLQAYPFLGEDRTYGGESHTASYSFHLGGRYFATGDLDVRCTENDRNAVCNFHLRKN